MRVPHNPGNGRVFRSLRRAQDILGVVAALQPAKTAAAVVILLPFVDVEKHLSEINTELLNRKKQAVLARGEVWVDPEEQQLLEDEEAERIHEEHRIEDLKARCAKKGLDFDTENAKYLAKQAKKAAKKKK